MNLAFALFRYFPFGGMQRDILAIAQLAAARGHRVTIYCHTWEGERPEGVDVEVLAVSGSTNHTRACRFDRALRERLQQTRPDLVVGFDKLSGLDFYFAADPCFVTRTAGRSFAYRMTPRYRAFRELERSVFASSSQTRILMLDPREQANYQKTWQTSAERFSMLPPGIERNRCKGPDADELRRQCRAEFGLTGDDVLLLLLAANFELKGLDRAMRAVAALPPALRARTRLLAVGAEPPRQLTKLADELRITPAVTMQAGRTDVPRLLQGADALLHPARRDTTGTVLLEAVAAELPVVCTAACGFAEHITAAGSGIVVAEPFQQASLDEAVHRIATMDRTDMQNAAHAYRERHDLHGMHDHVLELIGA